MYTESEKIYLTRGDSAVLNVKLTTEAGEGYEMDETDRLTLTVKSRPEEEAVLLVIHGAYGSPNIPINGNDTIDMAVGRYSCDIVLSTLSGEYTVYPFLCGIERVYPVNTGNFVIMPRVHS